VANKTFTPLCFVFFGILMKKNYLNSYANIDDEPFAKAKIIDLGYESGLYSILFLYARQGNFIIKGKLATIKSYITDNLKLKEYFYNITFWKNGVVTNSHWDFYHPYLQYRRLHKTRISVKTKELIFNVESKNIKLNEHGDYTPGRNIHAITLNSEGAKIITFARGATGKSFYNHPIAFFRRMPKAWLSEFNQESIKEKLEKVET
jgi:hypothetical protein